MGWVNDDNLYYVAFDRAGLPLLTHLSGLVDIREVVWSEETGLLSLIVKTKKDRLFEEGDLIAQPIKRYRRTPSGKILAESKVGCQSCHTHTRA